MQIILNAVILTGIVIVLYMEIKTQQKMEKYFMLLENYHRVMKDYIRENIKGLYR